MDLVQPFIKLICEGKASEPHYFVGYLHSRGFRLPNMVYQPKDHSPMGISREALAQYKEARKLKIPPNNILIAAIFDRDLHPGVSNAIEMLRESPIITAFSNICFEYWILLHFETTTRPFRNCDEIISFIRENHDPDYGKSRDHFTRLKDRIPTAIRNATQITENRWNHDDRPIWEINPYTDVFKLLEKLDAI